jgi:hypothetical protein
MNAVGITRIPLSWLWLDLGYKSNLEHQMMDDDASYLVL